jgi:hypothetical protein
MLSPSGAPRSDLPATGRAGRLFRREQSRAEAFVIEAWDALLATDGYACITLHPRADLGIGRAARITMIERARRLGSGFRLCREAAAESGRRPGSGAASGSA